MGGNRGADFENKSTEMPPRRIAARHSRAFRFELTKVQVPAIRVRMVSSLVNVAEELARGVAEDLGIDVPEAMPKALERNVDPPGV